MVDPRVVFYNHKSFYTCHHSTLHHISDRKKMSASRVLRPYVKNFHGGPVADLALIAALLQHCVWDRNEGKFFCAGGRVKMMAVIALLNRFPAPNVINVLNQSTIITYADSKEWVMKINARMRKCHAFKTQNDDNWFSEAKRSKKTGQLSHRAKEYRLYLDEFKKHFNDTHAMRMSDGSHLQQKSTAVMNLMSEHSVLVQQIKEHESAIGNHNNSSNNSAAMLELKNLTTLAQSKLSQLQKQIHHSDQSQSVHSLPPSIHALNAVGSVMDSEDSSPDFRSLMTDPSDVKAQFNALSSKEEDDSINVCAPSRKRQRESSVADLTTPQKKKKLADNEKLKKKRAVAAAQMKLTVLDHKCDKFQKELLGAVNDKLAESDVVIMRLINEERKIAERRHNDMMRLLSGKVGAENCDSSESEPLAMSLWTDCANIYPADTKWTSQYDPIL